MSKFEDRLWRELVRRHGADLAQMTRPAAKRARRARPRLLAGTSLALAGVVAALALVLSAASSPPAFAVSRNPDGTVTVTIHQITAIPRANARLAGLGIRARLVEVAPGCTVKALPPAAVAAMKLATSMAGSAAPQVAIARLDPRKIPAGKWQVIIPDVSSRRHGPRREGPLDPGPGAWRASARLWHRRARSDQ